MKRLLFPSLLGAVALLAPGRILAQDKPVLNTAPIVVPAPAPVVTPAPVPVTPPTPVAPAPAPTSPDLPVPGTYSPSGFELPEREQKRKALEQHAEQYTKTFLYSGVGLGYTSYSNYSIFSFSISPAIGYRVTERFSIGPGISYAYNNYGFSTGYSSNSTTHISTSSFGVKGFAQFMVYKQFFVHAEYEVTRAELLEQDFSSGYLTGRTVSTSVKTPLLGAGYRSQISNRAAADIVLLYNFNDGYNSYSLYPNPVIRFNFLFNLGH